MLEIKSITKKYKTGELEQIALDKVDLTFRNNEFVSILGPSGSGKTTLLNIIGGLDRYDDGDLIINNVSTKKYKDRDWDSYRNHTIGFVFQSYNLIPHQTVLANVELALTIGGISKQERKTKALEALEKVGLKEQAHKKPTQMSGGQMQRVAIARALVNNPDILLADEPTGALDTVTSIQVMQLLKEVAKDRLVIMVTHNPELAKEYSTRIVKLKDGKIINDSNPYSVKKSKKEKIVYKNLGKSSMSIFTAFSLSLNNLLTKKGRTILTAFAGSIGIIGIAMILSLSTGFQNYVDKIQEDTLTSYPLTINQETSDMTALFMSDSEKNKTKDKVIEKQNISEMFGSVGKNDLKSFKKYLEDNEKEVEKMVSLTKYTYSVNPMIFTKNNNEIIQLNPNNFLSSLMGGSSNLMTSSGFSVFNELVDDEKMLEEQFKVIKGRMPKKYDEVILILPSENEISDLLLYSLGIRDFAELEKMIADIAEGKEISNKNKPLEFTYEELMELELKLLDATDTYKYNEKYNIYESMLDSDEYMNNIYNKAEKLKIVGVVYPKEKSLSLNSGIGYTKDLTKYVIKTAEKSDIVKKQLADKNMNVFSGKKFDDTNKNAGLNFQDMVTIDKNMLSSAFGTTIQKSDIENMTKGYMDEISKSITIDTKNAQAYFLRNLSSIMKNIMNDYYSNNQIGGIAILKLTDVPNIVETNLSKENNKLIFKSMQQQYVIPEETFRQIYSQIITNTLQQYIVMMSDKQDSSAENDTDVNEDSVNENIEFSTSFTKDSIEKIVESLINQEAIISGTKEIANTMTEATMRKTILTKVGTLTQELIQKMSNAFQVDEEKIANAFKFDISEDEMRRLFETMSTTVVENANTNLLLLGYQDINNPTSISFYFKDFEAKEKFIDYIADYNNNVSEEKVISYNDLTGLLMSSVKTIVNSVSYVLIAFVSISLIVSSIMIGIITYISVLERTKEIGVLRAIGASKRNISSIFNAETFIIGLFSGVLAILTTLLLLIPCNMFIHSVNSDVTAVLPTVGAIILIILSIVLTLIGGIIPSRQASKKDPVLALRSE